MLPLRLAALSLAPLLFACSSSDAAPAAGAPGDAGPAADDAADDDAAADAAPAPILDPALFDCTAKGIPDRASTVPASCAMDRGCTTRMVAAHRGAGGQLGKIAPEDTLAAYRAGIALGVDFVETDPRPTKDGKLVNLHDTSVDRTTDGHGDADEMTLEEIRALHVRASAFPGDFSCERIPTLEEILTTCKGRVVVLVDANKTDRVDLLVQAIQTTGAIDWALFDTSDVGKIDQALALEPSLHTMIRVASPDDANAQLDHFAAHPPDVVEIEGSAPLAATAAAVHARGHRALTDAFGQDASFSVTGDASIYAEVFDKGVDIAQTDRPDAVLSFLGRR